MVSGFENIGIVGFLFVTGSAAFAIHWLFFAMPDGNAVHLFSA